MTKDQLKQLEKELWNAADNLRANSDLKSSEYAIPDLRQGTLQLGRTYSNLTRNKRGVTVYDEVALPTT